MKILTVFSMFFISYNSCVHFKPRSQVDFPINEGEGKRFPWAVIIHSISKDIAFDGSLIHPRVVMTAVTFEPRFHVYGFRVSAGCYSKHQTNIRTEYQGCEQNRTIEEWNTIIRNKAEYGKNFAILILLEPFKITEKVDVIRLPSKKNDINFNYCAIVYYSDKCSKSDNCTVSLQYFSSLFVRIDEEMNVKFNFGIPESPPFILDDQSWRYSFEEISDDLINFTFTGSPVVCKTMNSLGNWFQVGVSYLRIQNREKNKGFKIYGYLVRVYNSDITVFNKILRLFNNLNDNVSFCPDKIS